MSEVIWTIALVSIGVTGLWLAPRTWWGWVVNAVSEMLWFAYAITLGSRALALMALVWLTVNVRNAIVSWRRRDLRAA